MTPVSTPSLVVTRTFDAPGSPVCSTTGSASMSARTRTTGPGPFSITATIPVPPTFSVTLNPNFRASAARMPAERTSMKLSSGLACRS
jgi:hypothetical protein